MKKEKKWCHFRHKVTFSILWGFFRIYTHFKYCYKPTPFKMEKNQNYLILANHACSLDPFLLALSFRNKPIYFMATDDIMKIKGASYFIEKLVAPIPKKKQTVDFQSIKTCIQVAKEGGNICIFPEGNRTFSGELSYIAPSILKLIRKLNLPVLLYKFEGGYGIDPRFGNQVRKGKSAGYVNGIITPEQLKSLSDDELMTLLVDGITYHLDYKKEYKSKAQAEYLERVLFYCPECHSVSTLYSDKDKIKCKNCSLEYTYTSKLTFTGKDVKFPNVYEWYQYQKEYVRNLNIEEKDILFDDEDVTVLKAEYRKRKEEIITGHLYMYKDSLVIKNEKDELVISFDDLLGLTVTGKQRIAAYFKDNSSMTLKSKVGFNAYKYALMYYRILDKMEEFF